MPDEALRQDPQLLERIGQYRSMREAISLMEGGEEGAKMLNTRPDLMQLLKDVNKAQGEWP